ncbi:hypothetical protein BDV96DRAFT_595833 [Lophiotrema nucula]|uniref:Glucose-methanol-choline oxidoreductase N-terminal domain-containing protein n=1 Tax=Lophiotrema nucula TaxID=690887 RepID=A0A6A5ZLM5_9PLEO|nr:hypothetical protein BDV96DRAFT_595833 [Lophiotrema nucula]
MSSKSTVDYIVVGGGTAGVVIASRLSQYLPSADIVLLEAGLYGIDDPIITNPLHPFHEVVSSRYVINYSTTPQSHCNNREILNLAGRMLSGSSGINVGVWLRASNTDYALVAQKAGHERFTFENLLPYFRKVENYWDKDADAKYHGFEGPIQTVPPRNYPLKSCVQKSAEALGNHYNSDSMAGDPTGLVELTQCYKATSESSATRQHSGKVYDLSKVDVRCETPVTRILFDDTKRAIGVELLSGEKIYANKEVIVSCGSQKTPQILMLSGIGPSSELSKHSIPQVVDSPGVGQNLFDHASITQYFKLRHPEKGFAVPFKGQEKPEFGQGFPWDWMLFNNIAPTHLKPSLLADNAQGADNWTHPHLQEKRCHYMCIPLYFPMLVTPEYNPNIELMGGTHIALTSLDLLPISRGTVTLRSADPRDEPLIDPKYMSTATDRFILRTAVRTNLLLTETEPLKSEIFGEDPPADPQWPALTSKSSDEEIDARIAGFLQTIAHPMGTCALGTVLDDEFKVKGVQGLRVCDASVFPEPIGAMPGQTVYALAELCADLVAGGA